MGQDCYRDGVYNRSRSLVKATVSYWTLYLNQVLIPSVILNISYSISILFSCYLAYLSMSTSYKRVFSPHPKPPISQLCIGCVSVLSWYLCCSGP